MIAEMRRQILWLMKEFGRKAVNMDVWQKLVKLSPNGRLLWKFHLIYKEGGLRGHFVAGFFVFFSIRLLFFHHNCYPSPLSLPPGQQWKRRYEWKSIFGALISLLWLFLWCPIDSLYIEHLISAKTQAISMESFGQIEVTNAIKLNFIVILYALQRRTCFLSREEICSCESDKFEFTVKIHSLLKFIKQYPQSNDCKL